MSFYCGRNLRRDSSRNWPIHMTSKCKVLTCHQKLQAQNVERKNIQVIQFREHELMVREEEKTVPQQSSANMKRFFCSFFFQDTVKYLINGLEDDDSENWKIERFA